MVPMLTCGFVRSNFAFATVNPLALVGLFGRLDGLVDFPGDAGLLEPAANYSPMTFATPITRLEKSSLFLSCSLSRRLRDDFLRHVRRNLGVGVELHRVVRPALRLGTQITDVAEHLRQRYQSLDDASAGALLHRLDLATPRVEVTDHVTHVLFGRDHL